MLYKQRPIAPTRRNSKTPGNTAPHTIIGHGLKGSIQDAQGNVHVGGDAQSFAPGERHPWPGIPGGHNPILPPFTSHVVVRFAFVINIQLQAERLLFDEEKISTRPSGDGQFVAEPITKIASRSNEVLKVGGEEQPAP